MPLKTIDDNSKIKLIAISEIKTKELTLKTIDPQRFMTKKEAKTWKKLPTKQKEKILEKVQQDYWKNQAKKERMKGNSSSNTTSSSKNATKKNSSDKSKNLQLNYKPKSSSKMNGVASVKVDASKLTSVAKSISQKASSMASEEVRKLEIQEEQFKSAEINKAVAKEVSTITKTVATPVQALASFVPGLRTAIAAIVPLTIALIFVIILFTTLITAILAVVASEKTTSGAKRIVQVALQEEQEGPHRGGDKYWSYMGFTSRVEWCASFVSWAANECGFIESGEFPKSASVSSYMEFFQQKGLYQQKGAYTPKEGDLIIFKNGMSHIGIVQYVEGNQVVTIEGNTSDMVHTRSYPLDYYGISGYCTPQYPSTGDSIDIPEPFGTTYTYMGWQMITSPSSAQYKLRQQAGQTFDTNGFGKIGNRYVIACTSKFGNVGDYIDWELENGQIISSVIGDMKNGSDPGINEWGHKEGAVVVEFVVDKGSWYGTSNTPTKFHPEWNSRVIKAYKVGSYW